MKRGMMLVVVFVVIFVGIGIACAQKGPVETALEGCKDDLETYCKNVMPGEQRILACLYAHEDKLSGRCVYALYNAASKLERAAVALKHLANECEPYISSLCADTVPGEGRILKCLENNEAKVSSRCKQAAKDVGLKRAKKAPAKKKVEKPAAPAPAK